MEFLGKNKYINITGKERQGWKFFCQKCHQTFWTFGINPHDESSGSF